MASFSAATTTFHHHNLFIPSPSPSPSTTSCWLPHVGGFHAARLSSSAIHRSQCCTSLRDAHVAEVATKEQSVTIPFHLAIPVHDITAAREFYGGMLGLPEGRSAKTWVDFNLYGHQLVCHQVANYNAESSANPVDGDLVPVPHFGLAMSVSNFLELAQRVEARGVEFIIKPHVRFIGQPGEQWTMFFKDRSGNSLEFKAMTNPSNLFAK